MPWVFFHKYWCRKQNKTVIGPYKDRKKFMKTLCREAKVPYFRFHAIRHSGASILAKDPDVSLVDIKTLLGHEKITTTAIYIQDLEDNTKETIKALNKKITQKTTQGKKKWVI